MRHPFLVLALLGLLASSAVRAHDFWIEPSTFAPAPGQRVAVRLRVGEHFKGDPVPRDPRFLERFAAVGPSGEVPVVGLPNTEPAGFLTLEAPGRYLIVYDGSRDKIQLEGKKFEEYLAQEGLERISELRARRGQSAAPVKEVFSRCAKALITVGGGTGAGYDRVLGLPLELIPEADPTTLKGGGALPLRVLYEGKPIAGVLVVAIARDRPDHKVSARSDGKGRVRLPLDEEGIWLVKAVHMVPAPKDAGAEWESFWASLTFGIPAL